MKKEPAGLSLSLGADEYIADAGFRKDIFGPVGVILYLLAQVADISPEVFQFIMVLWPPHIGQQLPVQHHPSAVAHQLGHKLVLG